MVIIFICGRTITHAHLTIPVHLNIDLVNLEH